MKKSFILKGMSFLTILAIAASCSDDKILEEGRNPQGEGQAEIVLTGNIAADQTLSAANTYLLQGFVRVQDGVTLTIPAGTVLKGVDGGGNPGTLIVERGAKVKAQGTQGNPVVFTSNEPAGSRAPGDWGGVVILGKAYSNIRAGIKGAPADFKGAIEGIPATETPGFYGTSVAENGGPVTPTTNDLDNSGILQYVRIEYAGNTISVDNELNGLTLGGVGRGTTIDHVIVAYGSDDGIEWFGGTVRMKYVVAYGNADDDLDNDTGNLTKLQFAIAQKNPAFHVNGSGGARGIESNGDDDEVVAASAASTTNAAFSNLTLVGPQGPSCNVVSTDFDNGIIIRDLSRLDIFNSLITGFPEHQYFLENIATFGGRATTKNNRWAKINPAPGSNVGDPFVAAKWANQVVGSASCVAPFINTQAGLPASAWSYPTTGTTYPNFVPVPGAAVLGGASFTDTVLQGVGFNVVTFRGAVNGQGTTGPGSPADWALASTWYDLTPQDNAY